MKTVIKYFQKIEEAIMIGTFSVMVIASFIQVVNRNIFQIPILGLEEIAKYSMVYMVLLGTELGLRDGTQISIDTFVDSLKGKVRIIVKIISKLALIIFTSLMLIEAVKLVQQQISTQQISPGLQLPMYIPYAALVLSFGLITIVQTALLIQYLQTELSGKNKIDEEVQS